MVQSPFVTEFLALSLARFIAVSAYRGQRWTKSRIANYITGSEQILGIVSDTTIGRLLDPSSMQEPSAATLDAVAAFLIEMKAITPEQIALAGKSPSLVEAISFASMFPRPRTAAYARFLGNVAGRYSAVEARGHDLISSELVARLMPEAGVLIAQEVLAAFHVDDIDLLKRETRNLTPDAALGIRAKLRTSGGREIGSATLTGFMIATPDIMVLMLRGGPGTFQSIMDVSEVEFDDEDRIQGLSVRRNEGWSVAGTKDRAPDRRTSFRSIVRAMAREMSYSKYNIDKSLKKKLRKKKINKKDTVNYDFMSQNSYSQEIYSADDHRSVAERLIAAIEHADIDAFRVALDSGADPNMIYPHSADPIVFVLAADGKLEFVEALIATRRCNLTRAGASGMPPSHAPGVTARMFAATGPAELVERFKRLAIKLREDEARQLRRTAPPTLDR